MPRAMRVRAPRMWAIIGASLGKQKVRTSQNNPTPKAKSDDHNKVVLKFW